MPLESSRDFDSYVNPQIGGVSATFFEVQNSLWDSRLGLIDTWFDIDSGNSTNINIIIDQDFFNIQGKSVSVEGYQPRAMVKATDVPYISIDDRLVVNAITTNNGSTLTPETNFIVVNAQPDNVGMVNLVLAVQ
jgi:hypothetical protein|tara:strand:- start:249 stop:650 length:402 start_codon:yes stop_codon:yes gene_type:complete